MSGDLIMTDAENEAMLEKLKLLNELWDLTEINARHFTLNAQQLRDEIENEKYWKRGLVHNKNTSITKFMLSRLLVCHISL